MKIITNIQHQQQVFVRISYLSEPAASTIENLIYNIYIYI